jgi:hypothetical protein
MESQMIKKLRTLFLCVFVAGLVGCGGGSTSGTAEFKQLPSNMSVGSGQ